MGEDRCGNSDPEKKHIVMRKGDDPRIWWVDDDEKICERDECEKAIEGRKEEVRPPAQFQKCSCPSLHISAKLVASINEPSPISTISPRRH
jgi:hypothetical protein